MRALPHEEPPHIGERGSVWPEQEELSREWHFMLVALSTGENGLEKNPQGPGSGTQQER